MESPQNLAVDHGISYDEAFALAHPIMEVTCSVGGYRRGMQYAGS